MKRKKLAVLLIAVMVLSFGLSACGSDEGGSSSSGGGGQTLIIQDTSWQGVDMFQCSSWNDMQCLMADPILDRDNETGAPTPCIASEEKWSEDGLTWTLTFPEGMYYSTGEQVEPEDFIASVEWGREVSEYAEGYANIESMEVDGRDVIVHLSEYKADMEWNFMSCFTGLIDKDELDTMSKDELLWGAHPYGPYYLDEYEAGAYAVLKANEGYMTHNPKVENKGVMPIKEIRVEFTGEAFTWAEGIQNGEYDVLTSVPMEYYDELSGNEDITVVDSASATLSYFEMNMTNPILSDKNVRLAIMKGINRDNFSNYLQDIYPPAYSLVVSKCQNYDPAAEEYFKANYDYDFDAAVALLEEAGWTDTDGDGFRDKDGQQLALTFSSQDSEPSKSMAQSIQSDMKALGINMDITTQEWSYVNQDVVDGNFDLAYLSLGWNEPFLLLDRFCQRNPEVTNPDPETQEAMVADARSTVDFDERTAKITEIQKYLMDYATIVPCLDQGGYRCWRSEIQGIVHTPTGGFYLADVVTDEDGNFRNVA